MELFYFDDVTFEHLTTVEPVFAQPDPLDAGKYLYNPNRATLKAVPTVTTNEVAVFNIALNDWEIKPDYREAIYYLKTDGSPVTFAIGDIPDATMQTTVPVAIQLERDKEIKRNEIRGAFGVDCIKPILVDGINYHGGLDSAYRLDGAYRLKEKESLTEVTFTDINNVKHVLTMAAANTVIITVGKDYETKFMKKQQLMLDIDNAVDKAALELIVY